MTPDFAHIQVQGAFAKHFKGKFFYHLFNGFQKKSQKTPTGEIEKALKIKAEYFIEKVKSKGHGNKK